MKVKWFTDHVKLLDPVLKASGVVFVYHICNLRSRLPLADIESRATLPQLSKLIMADVLGYKLPKSKSVNNKTRTEYSEFDEDEYHELVAATSRAFSSRLSYHLMESLL